MSAVATTCPFCACGCGLYLLSREGQLVGVAPGESHPVSEGRLCARGWSAHEASLWGDRLTRPLLQRNGKQEAVSWAEALDYVAERFKQFISAGKPVGVLGSSRATNEENYLAGKLARAGLQTNHIGFSYYSMCRSLLSGFEEVCGECPTSARIDDVAWSEVILLIEGNLAETHPQLASAVMNALENDAQFITISCKKTQMTRLASVQLPAKPGMEGDVVRALLAGALDLKLPSSPSPEIDREALRRELQSVERTEDARKAVDLIARCARATFLIPPGWGPSDQQTRTAGDVARLAAVTGHLAKPGSGLSPLLARSNVRGACDMGAVPDRLPGYEPLRNPQAVERIQRVWGKTLPVPAGQGVETLLESVSALLVVADNPASVLPMQQKAMDAMRGIEFLVVLDSFDRPAAQIAHAQLPIASFAETEGTVTSMEDRVQKLRPATDPPGEARPGWKVLAELCARFGLAGSYGSALDVLREIGQAAPRYAGIERMLAESAWGEALLDGKVKARFAARPSGAAEAPPRTSPEQPYLLALDGSFDWGDDPLVSMSPTLSRDYRSERKLFPAGVVEVSQSDADALKLRPGRLAKLSSAHGESAVPVRINRDLKPGVLFVPYAFRNQVSKVLGNDNATAVHVECA